MTQQAHFKKHNSFKFKLSNQRPSSPGGLPLSYDNQLLIICSHFWFNS